MRAFFVISFLIKIIFLNSVYSKVLFDNSIQKDEIKIFHQKTLEKSNPKKLASQKKPKISKERGNLPVYARSQSKARFSIESVTKTLEKSSYILNSVQIGISYDVSLSQTLVAIEDQRTPISGFILNGPLMGYRFSGNCLLETFSKKIRVSIDKIYSNTSETFEATAQLISNNNTSIEPKKYISKKSKFLIKKVLSSFTKSWLESKVQTQSNLFFNNIPKNSLKSNMFLSLSQGAKSIAFDFEEALKQSKDVAYAEVSKKYQITFLTQPQFSNQREK